MSEKLKILLCDDHRLIRDGIKSLLKTQEDFDVIGEADNGKDAIRLALNTLPDIILMDIEMPESNGLEAVTQILKHHPQIKIIMLTVSEDGDDLFEAIKRGARGYLLKNVNMRDLFQAVRSVHNGETPFSPGLAEKVLTKFSNMAQELESKTNEATNELTSRELEILTCVASGLTNQDIANKLYISKNTVKKHLKNIHEKLQVQSRAQAVAYASRKGWIQENGIK